MAKDIAVVGCGYWGKDIVRNLYELGVLHTVCDVDVGVFDSMKIKYPEIKIVSHLDEVLGSSDIKAVAIATPSVTHYSIARKAILTDKDVFVEKPLSVNTKEAKELIKLAKEHNKVLMVGHILQYHPAIIRLKEIVEAGELGKIQYIYSNRLNIGKLRTEENILWSFAPHDISTILMLLDEEPGRVTSFGGRYITERIYDTTLTTLEFKNGVKGHIFVSWLHPYKEQRLVVVGTEAMAVFDDVGKEKLCIYPHTIEYKSGKIPVAQKAEYHAIPVEDKEPLKEELSHFIECIEKRRQPKTDGDEGLRVLKVLEEAEKSLDFADISSSVSREKKGYFIHESSCIDEDVQIGEGARIWHFSHVLKNSRIGKNCIIGQNVMIGPDVKIGDGCKIQNNVSLYKGVTLEEGVFCAPSCVFTNVYTPRAFIERKDEFLPTLVKKGATIGANATVVCGVTIGKYSFIGAGAVAKKDIPDYALVIGVPTRQIGWVCKCGVTLKEFNKKKIAQCKRCRSRYELQDKRLIAVEELEEPKMRLNRFGTNVPFIL